MTDTQTRNNLIATKLRELADLFHGSATEGVEDAPAPAAPAADTKRKPGRPAGSKTAPSTAAEDAPAETPVEPPADTITEDHPKRAELRAIANEYMSKTDRTAAQKAIKLFGESTGAIPDAELAGAIAHIKGLLKKIPASL